jgi:hypothetical protein
MLSGFGRILIEYNHLYQLSLETADTGAITANRWYTYPRDPDLHYGNIIRFNFIHDTVGCGAYGRTYEPGGKTKAGGRIWTPYYSWSIYFDNAPMNVLVYGNITARDTLGGIMISHYCHNVTVENNIFLNSEKYQVYLLLRGEMENIRFRHNIFSYQDPASDFLRFNVRGNIEDVVSAVVTEFDGNLYQLPPGRELTFTDKGKEVPDAARWREMGFDAHSVFADPKFRDPSRDDYTLSPDSPALELGFVPIDVSKIGLLKGQAVGAGTLGD